MVVLWWVEEMFGWVKFVREFCCGVMWCDVRWLDMDRCDVIVVYMRFVGVVGG